MAVIIRCRRTGANNDPCFRIVATDERAPRDGKYLEMLGWYDPKKSTNNFQLKLEKIDVWLGKGALLSATVRTLVNKARRGLTCSTAKKPRKKGPAKKAEKKEEPQKEASPAPAAADKP
ncbi:MAG: 30S ribosomal protein S16 [Kiritimatiellae bacterium]|nr:30S ribosomal protein S16 [Kiritimatiellia bacterium]